MDTDLIFLAAATTETAHIGVDKYLDGYATIQFTPAGGLVAAYDENYSDLVGGPFFFPAHPGVRTRFMAAPGYSHWPHRHVGFRGPLIEEWRATGLWLEEPQAAPPGRDAAAWDAVFTELMTLSRRSDRWGRRLAINRLESLLLELADARSGSAQGASSREIWLNDLLHRLAVDPNKQNIAHDYASIAQSLGMSTSTLQRRFKKAMNTSLHAYTLRSRVDAARTLLTETDMPLKAIADRLGYENVYFFSRQFQLSVGVSPGVFRKSRMG